MRHFALLLIVTKTIVANMQPTRPSITGRQSITGRTSIMGGRPSLARNSMTAQRVAQQANPVVRSRSKNGPTRDETELNWKIIVDFITEQELIGDVDIANKKFHLCTPSNFLDYLQIIALHFDDQYEASDLQKDATFWLNCFGYPETMNDSMFQINAQTCKYIIQAFAWLIQVYLSTCECSVVEMEEQMESKAYDVEGWFRMLRQVLENFDCAGVAEILSEHYHYELEEYMENYRASMRFSGNIDELKEEREKLTKKAKEFEKILGLIEKKKHDKELATSDLDSLIAFQAKLNENIRSLQECIETKSDLCNKKKVELDDLNKEQAETRETVTQQAFSKSEAFEYHQSTRQILDRAEVIRNVNNDLRIEEFNLTQKVVAKGVEVQSAVRLFVEEMKQAAINAECSLDFGKVDESALLQLCSGEGQAISEFEKFVSYGIEAIKTTLNQKNDLLEKMMDQKESELNMRVEEKEELEKKLNDLAEKAGVVAERGLTSVNKLKGILGTNIGTSSNIDALIAKLKNGEKSSMAEEVNELDSKVSKKELEIQQLRSKTIKTLENKMLKDKTNLEKLQKQITQIKSILTDSKNRLNH